MENQQLTFKCNFEKVILKIGEQKIYLKTKKIPLFLKIKSLAKFILKNDCLIFDAELTNYDIEKLKLSINLLEKKEYKIQNNFMKKYDNY